MGRGRGAEAIASTSMAAENTTVTVSWSLIKTSYTLLDEFTPLRRIHRAARRARAMR